MKKIANSREDFEDKIEELSQKVEQKDVGIENHKNEGKKIRGWPQEVSIIGFPERG